MWEDSGAYLFRCGFSERLGCERANVHTVRQTRVAEISSINLALTNIPEYPQLLLVKAECESTTVLTRVRELSWRRFATLLPSSTEERDQQLRIFEVGSKVSVRIFEESLAIFSEPPCFGVPDVF